MVGYLWERMARWGQEGGKERTLSLLLPAEPCLPYVGGVLLDGRVGLCRCDAGGGDFVLQGGLYGDEDGGFGGRVVDRQLCACCGVNLCVSLCALINMIGGLTYF